MRDTVADEEPHVLPHHCCRRLPGLSSRSHAVSNAVSISNTGNEEFLIGLIDRRGVTQSVNKNLDDASWAGVATEAELIVATGELVDADPQMRFLMILIATFQILCHKLAAPTDEDPQFHHINLAVVKFATWLGIKSARERTADHLLP